MASREAALRALHAQADFDVVGTGGELAAAVAKRLEAERRAHAAAARRTAVLTELRRLQAAGSINTAVVAAVRRAYRNAIGHETLARDERDRAAQAEDAWRGALAALRHRARCLERAADEEASASASARAVRVGAQLDDRWLAAKWRTFP